VGGGVGGGGVWWVSGVGRGVVGGVSFSVVSSPLVLSPEAPENELTL